MKRVITSVVLAAAVTGLAWSQEATMFDSRPRITVTGEAVVNVKPDKILITLGIETWDSEITTAKQKNNEILKQTVAAVKECGVPEKEMQTDHLSIEPRWESDYRNDRFIGYFVRNTLLVTIVDPPKVEEVITRSLLAGVNYIHGIDFQTTEFQKYREQARDLALRAARDKAGKMAAVLGKTAGQPLQINENYSGSPWWYYSGWSGWSGRSQGMSQSNVQVDRGGSGEITDTIALGKLTIKASVSVTFELKD